ncbi:MAG: 4-phosphoerythronate dehydrogenase, partial [Rikenella sp.]|nr:4-phosphoerythronate dehydrogenase [Rikenella sp.]
MKIVIDDKIPFIRGVFEPYAEVVYRPGGAIDAETVCEADALVIRTRTRCDEGLLDGCRVRIVATATIG